MDCPKCGEDFETERSMKIHHKLAHGESLATKTTQCENCDNYFDYYPSNKDGKYCSECVECDDVWWGAVMFGQENPMYGMTGDDNPRWEGGYKDVYKGKWSRIRDRRRRIDNYECKKCGKTKQEMGREPDVHHIEPMREFEDYQEAHTIENTICLCRTCHVKVENGKLEI